MVSRGLRGSAAVLAALVLAGCGGGGGSHAPTQSKQSIARQRAIETARLNRAILAVAGLARQVTRAPGSGMSRRIAILLSALHRSRDTFQGVDVDTGLYYTVTINPDGSGHEDLFTDVLRKTPAGSFTWGVPEWHNNQPNSYPAVIHVFYQITAGHFAGTHGTIDVTLNDANGAKALIHVILDNAHHEHCDANFDVAGFDVGGSTSGGSMPGGPVYSGTDNVTLDDGTTYTEVDEPQSNGDMICKITFPDGSFETLQMQPDGTSTETVTDPNGSVEASGNLQSDGTDAINYSDGSSETVNVDTAPTDSSGSSSGDSSGDSSGSSSQGLMTSRARAAGGGRSVYPHTTTGR